MRKFFLFPLRLSVGWGLSPRLLSLIAAVMLVLLRISVGWHFYSEGVEKRDAGDWTAAPFFANAKGPFADHFRTMVWDADGRFRLNKVANLQSWAVFREQAISHYGFDAAQKRRAELTYDKTVEQYDWAMELAGNELQEFELGRRRMDMLDNDERERSLRDGVSSLGGQRDTIRKEWMGKAAPTLAKIDAIWKNYELSQNAIATDQQSASRPYLKLVKPKTARIDTSIIDGVLPYFDIAIGLCLLLGLFTPIAALAAAVFLGSVFLSQYPPSTGPTSSNYQLIESMACLVLASTGAGRFAGLDYFLHLVVRRFWYEPDPDA